MRKLSFLFLAGFVVATTSYQMLAADTMAEANQASERQALEITTRNATFSAFTDARHLVEQARSAEPFAPPGRRLTGEYEGAPYRTLIISNGETISIYTASSMSNGADTVNFSVSADVVWTSHPVPDLGVTSSPYLVLKAYHEQ